MIRNLSHISLGTNSLEKVYKFYIEKLGLKIVHKFINKKNGEVYGYFISSNKNTYLEFFNSKKKIYSNRSKIHFRHICFEVKNIYNFAKKFKNDKIKVTRGKTDKILQFFVKDLEGNIVEFHQRDRKSKF